MGEFFKPWRRKFGVLTLLVACVAMAGWLRSPVTQDTVTLRIGSPSCVKLVSVSHRIVVAILSVKTDETVPISVFASQKVTPGKWLLNFAKLDVTYTISDQTFFKINTGFGINNVKVKVQWYQLPYWSIVVPLTLLSAFLLLTKPRKSTQMKITELIPEEGT